MWGTMTQQHAWWAQQGPLCKSYPYCSVANDNNEALPTPHSPHPCPPFKHRAPDHMIDESFFGRLTSSPSVSASDLHSRRCNMRAHRRRLDTSSSTIRHRMPLTSGSGGTRGGDSMGGSCGLPMGARAGPGTAVAVLVNTAASGARGVPEPLAPGPAPAPVPAPPEGVAPKPLVAPPAPVRGVPGPALCPDDSPAADA
jgi:hypothetical protein